MSTSRDIMGAVPHYLDRLLEAAPLKVGIGAIVSLASWAFGWLVTPGIHQAAVWLLMADWLTGSLKANLRHEVNSDAGVRGAVKSLIYLALLGVGYTMTSAGPIAEQGAQWVALAVLYTEAVSNLENLDAIATHFRADVPILKQAIAVLRMRVQQQTQAGTGPLPPVNGQGGSDA